VDYASDFVPRVLPCLWARLVGDFLVGVFVVSVSLVLNPCVVFLVRILFGVVLCALVLCAHPVVASWIGSGPDGCGYSVLKDWSER
jgi:hypothetical protein